MKKYRFDDRKLRFVDAGHGFMYYFWRVLGFLALSVLAAVVYYGIFSLFFRTPEQKALSRDNRMMIREHEYVYEKMASLDVILDSLDRKESEIYRYVFDVSPVGMESLNSMVAVTSSSDTVVMARRGYEASLVFADVVMRKMLSSLSNAARRGDSLRYMPSVPPVAGFLPSQVSASVGRKINPFYKQAAMHEGVDIVAAEGTDVLAPADGVVSDVDRYRGEDGGYLEIMCGKDYRVVFKHLKSVDVRRGQRVKRGDVVAAVGNTGISFAPHLHYEVWFKGRCVDPVAYMFQGVSPDDYIEIVLGSVNSHQSMD